MQLIEKKGLKSPRNGWSRAEKKTSQRLVFSVAVLAIQFYKYSQRLYDTLSLKVTFLNEPYSKFSLLEYTLSDDQSFDTVYKAVGKDLVNELTLLVNKKGEVRAEVEWVSRKEKNSTLKCTVAIRQDQDPKLVFFSTPSSLFSTAFERADLHFKILTNEVWGNTHKPIGELQCFSSSEADEVQALAYGAVIKPIADFQLHELFELTAERFSNRTAIQSNHDTRSYAELNKQANRLAHFLIRKGVQPGNYIGLLLERSPQAYIAILAILKTGAAYVPLDSDFPEERIQYILNDCEAKFLISNNSFRGRNENYKGTLINMDDLEDMHATSAWDVNPDVWINFELPAYIIYTSGSTGTPKGVAVSHRAVSNLVQAEYEIFKLSATDKVLQGFSLAFDASVEEIWLAFMSGAALVPASKALMCSGEDLAAFISSEQVSVFSTVPTLLSTMNAQLFSLRLLILGGESCSQELLQRWQRHGLRIVNTYGPTEATVIATYADFNIWEKITIGRPIQNCAAFITDPSMNLVPKGIPGELCLAGAGIAIGYLNRDELTAEKFIRPLFSIRPHFGERVYRTGDLVMMNQKGQIEFLGRIDSQVKLRGYRIELPEIESRLTQFHAVKSAAVAVKKDDHDIEKLVAYIILKDPSLHFDENACKTFLKATLSSYMVPSLFVILSEFPTLSSGKVDRSKLILPPNGSTKRERSVISARNNYEQLIHGVWEKYFSPTPVSVLDDFFLDLGGHSLLAAKMISELRQHDHLKSLSVVDVYKNPTIEKLAEVLETQQSTNGHTMNTNTEKIDRYIPSTIKHFWCAILQFLSLYCVFGFNSIMGATGYLIYFFLFLEGHSWIVSATWAVSGSMLAYPVVILLAIGIKWMMLGRIKPGRYKLWGWFYFRWWLVQNLVQVVNFSHFAGSPLLPILYRLLGAKIGKDVHIDSDHVTAFDLISIGDGTSIDEGVRISGHSIKDGYLTIGTITIGKECFVGERSVLGENVEMEDRSRIEDLSLLPSGGKIPAGETWLGSPARYEHANPVNDTPPSASRTKRAAITILYIALTFIIPVVSFISFIPGIAILFQFSLLEEPLTFLALLPVVGLTFVILLTLETVIIKWLLVGKVKPGKHRVHGSFYVRNWIVEQLLKLSLDYAGQLHATLHVIPWYRALGMKIGKHVELSTATSSTPDLIDLSDGSTIADEASLGSPHIERGWMTIDKIKIGRRAFVGNSGVVPKGIEMGAGSLVGVLSISPGAEDAKREHATWFGSPAILFPKRETSSSFSEKKTYEPPKLLRVARGAFELLRVTLPPAGFTLVTVSMITMALQLWEYIGIAASLALLPIAYGVSSVAVILCVAIIKWIVIGSYKPFVRPLWSNFIWRLELVNALYEFLSAPLILESLQGTPFLPWYLRLLGAKIGKQCYIDTTGFLEWDMINIGDRSSIGEDAVMQTHLFEDRILKASPFTIGSDCSVGAVSVVLYDTRMHDGAHLDALSLLMKGEVLPAHTRWRGIPARTVQDNTTLKEMTQPPVVERMTTVSSF